MKLLQFKFGDDDGTVTVNPKLVTHIQDAAEGCAYIHFGDQYVLVNQPYADVVNMLESIDAT